MITFLQGNALQIPLMSGTVQTVVTSPPYWGLRDYGTALWIGGDGNCNHVQARKNGKVSSTLTGGQAGNNHEEEPYRDTCGKCGAIRKDAQLGLERTPEEYVTNLVAVFREVWRVLRDDGTVWLNLGDSYAHGTEAGRTDGTLDLGTGINTARKIARNGTPPGLKPKDLVGIPWRVAFALQADGWYLRSDIVWSKPNPMPESVTDRPTKAHEYLFLLSKRERYYYDADAVREEHKEPWRGHGEPERINYNTGGIIGRGHVGEYSDGVRQYNPAGRNRRTVWTIATQPFSGAKLLADYVGSDGKPYKASPDCPIHGHLARNRTQKMDGHGEQSNPTPIHNPGNDGNRDQLPEVLSDANSLTTSYKKHEGSLPPHIPENNDGRKNEDSRHVSSDLEQIAPHTNHIQIFDEIQVSNSDLQNQPYSEIAIDHNIQMSKIDRVHQTSPRDSVSAQIPFHISNSKSSDEQTDSVDRISENNTSEDCASDAMAIDPLGQMTFRNVDKIEFPRKRLYCTCEIITIDHFATFPEKLVEPCILAGTSERGACPKCGKAWVRVVETTGGSGKSWHNHENDLIDGQSKARLQDDYKTTTIGWKSSCQCNASDPVPCLVLDPFSGSGTVGLVARKHNRAFVGLELKRDYIDLALERTAIIQPKLTGVE